MRILLSGNVQPWRSKSMPLYRTRLGDALRILDSNLGVVPYDPWLSIAHRGPSWMSRAGAMPDRLLYQAQRWLFYPAATFVRCDSSAADLLHVTDHSYGELARFARLPSVVTVHDLNPVRMRKGLLGQGPEARIGRVGWALFKRALQGLRSARAIICVSEVTRSDLLTEMPELESKVHVIWHGIDDAYLDSEPRIAAPEAIMLHVGHNWSYKNVDGAITLAIACHKALHSMGLPFRFIRAGAPLREDQLHRLQNQGVIFQQYVNADIATLAGLYRQARLFVFPSLHEGFGWPPLEAMACGTPAAVSRGGALQEVAVPGAEIVFDDPVHFSTDDIQACVDVLSDDSIWLRASETAQHYAAQFKWSVTARSTLQLYRQVVA